MYQNQYRFLDKVSDSVSVSDSVIFWDSVSVSVETQNHGFGRALLFRYNSLNKESITICVQIASNKAW